MLKFEKIRRQKVKSQSPMILVAVRSKVKSEAPVFHDFMVSEPTEDLDVRLVCLLCVLYVQ